MAGNQESGPFPYILADIYMSSDKGQNVTISHFTSPLVVLIIIYNTERKEKEVQNGPSPYLESDSDVLTFVRRIGLGLLLCYRKQSKSRFCIKKVDIIPVILVFNIEE